MAYPGAHPRHACDDKQLLQSTGHDAHTPLPGYEPAAHNPEKPEQVATETATDMGRFVTNSKRVANPKL